MNKSVLLLTALAAVPAAAEPLSLDEALVRALATSPRLEAARAGTAAARAQKRGARAQGMPRADVNLGGQFQGPSVSLPGSPPFTPPRAGQAGLDVSVPLYTGGRVRAAKKGARSAELAALAREDAEAQRLVLEVTEAYLDSLEAGRQVSLLGEQRRLDEERLRLGRIRLAAGVTQPLEVTQAEADLAESTQLEIEARARQRQAAATLNTLVGQPAEAPVELEPLPEPPAAVIAAGEPVGAAPVPTADEARALARERPELQALREDVRTAEAGVDRARAERRPFVSLSSNLLRRLPETLLGGFAWSVGGAIIQTLFDGGRTRAQVEAARADRQRAGATLKEAERVTEEQVEQGRVALEAAAQRLAAESARVRAAEAALDVARKQVAAGIAPRLQVTEAETVLARARTATDSARHAEARARARLAFLTGAPVSRPAPEGVARR